MCIAMGLWWVWLHLHGRRSRRGWEGRAQRGRGRGGGCVGGVAKLRLRVWSWKIGPRPRASIFMLRRHAREAVWALELAFGTLVKQGFNQQRSPLFLAFQSNPHLPPEGVAIVPTNLRSSMHNPSGH